MDKEKRQSHFRARRTFAMEFLMSVPVFSISFLFSPTVMHILRAGVDGIAPGSGARSLIGFRRVISTLLARTCRLAVRITSQAIHRP